MSAALDLMTTTAFEPEVGKPVIRLSDEQLLIVREIDQGRGNVLVEALAGTGKTFLILQCLNVMRGSIAIMAYGNEIAKEIRGKVVAAGHRGVDVRTFHSLGAMLIRQMYPQSKMEGKDAGQAGYYKFDRIVEEIEIPKYLVSFVKKLMSLAMQYGFGVGGMVSAKDKSQWDNLIEFYGLDAELADDNVVIQLHGRQHLIDDGIRFAYKALNHSRKLAHEVYGYDEMLWLPLFLNAKFPTFDFVCVDEAQDSNPARREMARRMMHLRSRAMFVGDSNQAIFAFTGASADALHVIRERFQCKVMRMTMTFRCGKAIVRLAQSIVPDYKAAPGNHEGKVSTMKEEDFGTTDLVAGEDAIICRNTRPLVPIAYALIKRGVSAHIEGKDIGKGLLAMLNRWQVKSLTALVDKLTDYKTHEVAKLQQAKQDVQAEALEDKVATIIAIIEGLPKGSTVRTLRDRITTMFEDSDGKKVPSVVLMTAHRSKGREYKRVFGWGRLELMPSKRAKKDHEMQQERNLEYVLITRSVHEYVDVRLAV